MVLSGRALAIVVVLVIALFAGYAIYETSVGPGSVTTAVPSSFTVNGRTFAFTYVATTQQGRTSGLMNRKVTNTTTMLFVFPTSGKWAFWMYDTNTSLDMVWVSAAGDSGTVVYVVAGAQPCFDTLGFGCPTYAPDKPANYVIEAAAGFAAASGITDGTPILFG